MSGYTSPGTFVDGSTAVPVDAANLNAMVAALVLAILSDGSGPTIAALLKVAVGAGFVNSADAAEFIGFGLNGSSLVGVQSTNNAANIGSGVGIFETFNSSFDGTNDHFLVSGSTAYQFKVGPNGLQWRKSTNTSTAGAVVTWSAYTTIAS